MKFERRKTLLGSVVVGIALVIGLLFFPAHGRLEPVYRGKTLSRWLRQLDDGEAFGISSGRLPSPTPAQFEAAEAIRALGAEALPLLLEEIHATPASDSFRMKAYRRLSSLAGRITGSRPLFGEVTKEDRTRWRAAQGLAVLGPLAKPAVPELRRLLFTNYFHSSIKEAAYVLATVGPEGIQILTNAVQPQTEWSGMCAIWALGQHPAAGTNVIPFLIGATSSASEGTACGAIQVLGLFQLDGEHVIPVLIKALANGNPVVRRNAARALGQFGPQAASAVPQLQSLTNNAEVKASALEALKRIQTSATESKKK